MLASPAIAVSDGSYSRLMQISFREQAASIRPSQDVNMLPQSADQYHDAPPET